MRSDPLRGLCVVLCLWAQCTPGPAAAQSSVPAPAAPANPATPIPEITIQADRLNPQRLAQIVVPGFVSSHGVPSPAIGQVGSWKDPVCPQTSGLANFADNELVSRRIMDVAASVGAPSAHHGPCLPNVDVVFTSDPQSQLESMLRDSPGVLGIGPRNWPATPPTFTHPIQAWYATVTRVTNARQLPGVTSTATGLVVQRNTPAFRDWDSDPAALHSWPRCESRGFSESDCVDSIFDDVVVIADTRALTSHTLASVADYIANLVLTRMDLDACSELPSIGDLFSAGCAGRAPPQALTDADVAYLQAMYGKADLRKRMAFEEEEMRDGMLELLRASVQPGSGGLPQQTFARYAGFYQCADGTLIAIRPDGERLMIQVGDELPLELTLRNEAELVTRARKENVRFIPADGTVMTALTLQRDGLTIQAARVTQSELAAQAETRHRRVLTQTPSPGGEAALRRLLEDLRSGHGHFDSVSPLLAGQLRRNAALLQAVIADPGPVLRVQLLGVATDGRDVYDVVSVKRTTRWRIGMGLDGSLTEATMEPADSPWSPPLSQRLILKPARQ